MPKVMQSGRRHARRQTQTEFGNQRVKRLADGFWAYTTAFCKGKQWSIDFTRLTVTFLYIVSEARRQPGPQRHNPALTEFRLANKQRVAVEIDVSQFQSDRFANAQPKSVKQSEDRLVGLRPVRRTRPIGECPHYFQQTLGVIEVEEIGNTLAGIAASCSGYRIARGEPLQHRPVEKAMEYT